MLSTLLNIAYLLPPVMRAFLRPPADDSPEHHRVAEAPALCLVPLMITAAGTLVLFVLADSAFKLLSLGVP